MNQHALVSKTLHFLLCGFICSCMLARVPFKTMYWSLGSEEQYGSRQIRALDCCPVDMRTIGQRRLQCLDRIIKLDGIIVHFRHEGQAKWTLLCDLCSGRLHRLELYILRARHVSQ